MGGRVQNTQLSGRRCEPTCWTGGEASEAVVESSPANRDASLADFSAEGVLGPLPTVPMAMSKGLPVDFGVLAEPKEAKAPPEPSAKALEPPVPMGDAKPPLGVVAAKGFARPWDDVAPLRRDRDEKSLA